jgi:hypothetical protein
MPRRSPLPVLLFAACGPSTAATDSAGSSSTGAQVAADWDSFELAYLAARHEVDDVPRWTLRLATPGGDDTVDLSHAPVLSDRVAWSPGGDAVAYISTSDSDKPYAARVVDVGDDVEVGRFGMDFGTPPSPTTTAVVWSASGQELTSTVPGAVAGAQCPASAGHSLWRVQIGSVAPSDVLVPDVPASPASWSAATGRLAYSTRFPVCDDFGVEHPDPWNVWQRPASGGAEPVVIPRPGAEQPDAWHPLWSPDGRRLAANVGRIDDARNTRVVVVELDGTSLPDVDSPACALAVVAWFPSGAELLTRGQCPDDSIMHAVVEVASGTVTQSFADLGPAVSIAPDGRRIAYTRGRDGETWVAILDRDTGDSTWVAPGEHPQWRPATP